MAVVVVIEGMRAEFGRELRVAVDGRVGVAPAGFQGALVAGDLPWPPGVGEDVGQDAAVVGPVAVDVHRALPGHDRGQVRWLQSGHVPLVDGVVGDAEQTDPAGAPRLDAGPLNAVVVVFGLLRCEQGKPALGGAGASLVDPDDDVAARDPPLGVDGLPVHQGTTLLVK